jgi:hypothetical protein
MNDKTPKEASDKLYNLFANVLFFMHTFTNKLRCNNRNICSCRVNYRYENSGMFEWAQKIKMKVGKLYQKKPSVQNQKQKLLGIENLNYRRLVGNTKCITALLPRVLTFVI